MPTTTDVPVDLVGISEAWTVDYWRLWVERSRYENRRTALDGRHGVSRAAIVPAAPLVNALRHDTPHAEDSTRRARLIRWRRRGYLQASTAARACDEYGLRPEIVWGARWHAVEALLAEGVVK